MGSGSELLLSESQRIFANGLLMLREKVSRVAGLRKGKRNYELFGKVATDNDLTTT